MKEEKQYTGDSSTEQFVIPSEGVIEKVHEGKVAYMSPEEMSLLMIGWYRDNPVNYLKEHEDVIKIRRNLKRDINSLIHIIIINASALRIHGFIRRRAHCLLFLNRKNWNRVQIKVKKRFSTFRYMGL